MTLPRNEIPDDYEAKMRWLLKDADVGVQRLEAAKNEEWCENSGGVDKASWDELQTEIKALCDEYFRTHPEHKE